MPRLKESLMLEASVMGACAHPISNTHFSNESPRIVIRASVAIITKSDTTKPFNSPEMNIFAAGFMKGSALLHTIGLFLVAILLFKSAASLIITFSLHTSSVALTEALPEEEKKSKAENEPDEFSEKALLPVTDVLFPVKSSSSIHAIDQSWQDVYPDTFTPPPNKA